MRHGLGSTTLYQADGQREAESETLGVLEYSRRRHCGRLDRARDGRGAYRVVDRGGGETGYCCFVDCLASAGAVLRNHIKRYAYIYEVLAEHPPPFHPSFLSFHIYNFQSPISNLLPFLPPFLSSFKQDLPRTPLFFSHLFDQSTTQPLNHSTTQPINQSTTQPLNQSTTQPINQSYISTMRST